jgi:dTDP-4-amino-4,6-dideoxygalactose transaminase
VRVPLLDLQTQYRGIREEIRHAVDEVLESQQFVLGPQVRQLEEAVAAYAGVAHAVGMSSGTDALLAALMAVGVTPGDMVIVPVFSFFATAGAAVRLGAIPLFVDIDPATFNIDPIQMGKRIDGLSASERERLKAIIPVHLYGQCAEMAPVLEVAETYGIAVVEDAAQSIGAQYRDGRCAGSMGRAGCFSFFPTKNLGGAGDGGMVLTNDAHLATRLRMLRVHGAELKNRHPLIGGNFRLDTLQAAILQVKLRYLDQWIQARQARAEKYVKLFAESGLLGERGVAVPETRYRATGIPRYHVFHQFVIQVPYREHLRIYLREAGIETEVYYPVPFHLQECFRPLGYGVGDFPEAERAAHGNLAIPMYPELTEEQQVYVVDRITSFLKSRLEG